MRVAIIGAGISGLACAVELQRHGITPTIFERTKMLGDKPGILVAALRMFHRSLRSPMGFTESKFGISLTPLHPITEMIMYTPNKTVSTKGNHGYVFRKGIEDYSLEHQIAAHMDIPIVFDTNIKIQDVKNDYDHIVVATANESIPNQYNLWTTTFIAPTRVATVSGDFKQNTMLLWLNKTYAKNGNAYLLAKNLNEAELVLAVSDIKMDRLDYYWNEFLMQENISYTITKSHDVLHIIGYPAVNQLENMYFVGNCGGVIDDFLGFGMQRALESGILAARAIVDKQDFNKLMEPLRNEVNKMHDYRKMMNVLNNQDLDLDMSIIGAPVLKHMIYNNPLYKAKYGVLAPKILTYMKTKNFPFRHYIKK